MCGNRHTSKSSLHQEGRKADRIELDRTEADVLELRNLLHRFNKLIVWYELQVSKTKYQHFSSRVFAVNPS
jgi:hypothetical protein